MRNNSATSCILNLISMLFNKYDTLMFLDINDDLLQFNLVKNPVLNLQSNVSMKLLNTNLRNFNNYLILSENEEVLLKKLKYIMKKPFWDPSRSPRGKYLLILKTIYRREILFETLWSLDITNLFIFNIKKNLVFTWDPFSEENNCGTKFKIKFVRNCLETTNLSFISDRISFPRCNISASVISRIVGFPFIKKTSSSYSGLFVLPLRTITEKLKMDLNIYEAPIDQQNAYLLNQSILFVDIENKIYDVFIANSWRHSEINDPLEKTNIFFTDDQFWIVPKPGRMNSFKVIISVFTLNTWILIFAVVFVVSFSWWLLSSVLNRSYEITTIFLIQFSASVGVSVNTLPRENVFRILFLFYAVYAFHTCYYFQGKLSSILTKPYDEKGINTFEDLLESDLVPLLVSSNIELLKEYDDAFTRKFLHKVRPLNIPGSKRLENVAIYKNISLPLYRSYMEISKFKG